MMNKISLRTGVLEKMANMTRRAYEMPEERQKQVVRGMMEAFKSWQPHEDWYPSESELAFILNLRKQYPELWEEVSGISAVDWDEDNSILDNEYASSEVEE